MRLGGGRRFRDIVHWRQQSDGQQRFTLLYSPHELTTDRKDQILVLALHLVCNYPRLLYVAMASAEVRFIATPVEHPASAFVEVAQRRNFAWILGHMGLPSGPRWNPKKTCNGVFRWQWRHQSNSSMSIPTQRSQGWFDCGLEGDSGAGLERTLSGQRPLHPDVAAGKSTPAV